MMDGGLAAVRSPGGSSASPGSGGGSAGVGHASSGSSHSGPPSLGASGAALAASSSSLSPPQPPPEGGWNRASPWGHGLSEFIHSPPALSRSAHGSSSSPRPNGSAGPSGSQRNSPSVLSPTLQHQQQMQAAINMSHVRSSSSSRSPDPRRQASDNMDHDAGPGAGGEDVQMRTSDSQQGFHAPSLSRDMSAGDANGDKGLFSAEEANFMAESLSSADKMDPFTGRGFVVPTRLPPRLGFGMSSAEYQEPPAVGLRQLPRASSHHSPASPHSQQQHHSPQHYFSPAHSDSRSAEASGSRQRMAGQGSANGSGGHASASPEHTFSPHSQSALSPGSLRAQNAASAMLRSRPSWEAGLQQPVAGGWPPSSSAGPGPGTVAMSTDRGSQQSHGQPSGLAFVDQFGPASSLRDVAEGLRKERGGLTSGPAGPMTATAPVPPRGGPDATDMSVIMARQSDPGELVPNSDMQQAANPLGPAQGMTNLSNRQHIVPLSAAALEAHQQVFGHPSVRRPPAGRGPGGPGGTDNLTTAGYGNNPQWQVQQLQFLQEQRELALMKKERAEQEAREQARMAALQPSLSQISQAFPSSHHFPGGAPHPHQQQQQHLHAMQAGGSHGPMGSAQQQHASSQGQDGSKPKTNGPAVVFSASGWKPTYVPIEVDPSRAKGKMPAHMLDLLEQDVEFKKQPHLQRLRDQIASGEIEDPQIKVRKQEAERERERKRKEPHQLLTEAEKKANHIASEQKRRANIKKGYEGLNELVPALRDPDGGRQGGNGGGDDESSDDDSDEADASRKKKGVKKEDDSKQEAARSGPRSEAVVLHKTLEYIREQLEEHAQLLARRKRARAALAAHYGVDIRVPAKNPFE